MKQTIFNEYYKCLWITLMQCKLLLNQGYITGSKILQTTLSLRMLMAEYYPKQINYFIFVINVIKF